jgi:hypothetical protein
MGKEVIDLTHFLDELQKIIDYEKKINPVSVEVLELTEQPS